MIKNQLAWTNLNADGDGETVTPRGVTSNHSSPRLIYPRQAHIPAMNTLYDGFIFILNTPTANAT